jgi:hypothetical protein
MIKLAPEAASNTIAKTLHRTPRCVLGYRETFSKRVLSGDEK